MVKPKGIIATNPKQGLPTIDPTIPDPNVPVAPVPTPDQQDQIISAFEKKTGSTFTPTTSAPTTFVGQPKPDTRSTQQKLEDSKGNVLLQSTVRDNMQITPEEISSKILKKLRDNAERYLKCKVEDKFKNKRTYY